MTSLPIVIPRHLEAVLDQIPQLIAEVLPARWDELSGVVHHALPRPLPRLLMLPVACASAGGGKIAVSAHAAAAWAALNLSLRILDDLQDRDREDGVWCTLGPSRAFHIAATLRELATSIVTRAPGMDASTNLAAVADMTHTLMLVGRGQDTDLCGGGRDLATWWAVIQDKSGELFALACRLGCRFSGVDPERTVALSHYGFHLGMALQLLDDLASVLPAEGYRDLHHGRMGFPVRAALALQADRTEELEQLISGPPPWDSVRIARLIEATGAAAFTLWTAAKERQRALGYLSGLDYSGREVLEQLCTAPFPAASQG